GARSAFRIEVRVEPEFRNGTTVVHRWSAVASGARHRFDWGPGPDGKVRPARRSPPAKAPSPLRFAGALQILV
ncbi:MAG: hypothetical protein ACREA9_17965, partial [Pyrinomonadaceae bacterium]